jgi:hypothetical protein
MANTGLAIVQKVSMNAPFMLFLSIHNSVLQVFKIYLSIGFLTLELIFYKRAKIFFKENLCGNRGHDRISGHLHSK